MKKQKGVTVIELLFVMIWITVTVSWFINAYKLIQCDFEPSYKSEIIHAIGLLGPTAVVTVWHSGK